MQESEAKDRYAEAVIQAIRETTEPVTTRVEGHSMYPTLRAGDRVIVEHVGAEALEIGDFVVMDNGRELITHRLLGRTSKGDKAFFVTKGDAHRSLDPPWPESALVGRAKEVYRDGRLVRGLPERGFRRRLVVFKHRLIAALWGWLRKLAGLLLFLLLAVPVAFAAVTLVSFTATTAGNQVLLRWETASEVDNMGFNLYRRVVPGGAETRINDSIIPSEGSVVGARYQFQDADVSPGECYAYWLESVSSSGQTERYGPKDACIPTPTAAPSPTPSPFPTLTPSVTPSPTSTPVPGETVPAPTPTATSEQRTPTATATSAPSPTAAPSPTTAAVPTPRPARTPTPPNTVRPATRHPTQPPPTPTNSPTPQGAPATPSPTRTPVPLPTATAQEREFVPLLPSPLPPPTLVAAPTGRAHPWPYLAGAVLIAAGVVLLLWSRRR